MGRVRANINIAGKNYWALFDTGARNTYVTEEVAKNLLTCESKHTEPVSLGGRVHSVTKNCFFECFIEGLPIKTHARVLNEIGADEDGKKIEILIGALTMQEWGITPIPAEERLDMSRYPKEFVEFVQLTI
jgi:hypothetical protein